MPESVENSSGAVDVVEIQITCGSADEAAMLAGALVESRLAACVQQFPIRSTYRWEGELQRDEEILLLVKTTARRFGDVRALVAGRHSYDVPAITAVPVVDGSAEYLDWVAAETNPGDDPT